MAEPFWTRIDKYRKESTDPGSYGCYIALNMLIPATGTATKGLESAGLQVRVITHARLRAKVESLERGYSPNCPFTVRDNNNGTYTILDGNHRFAAMVSLIQRQEKQGIQCIYTMEYKVPCLVFRSDIPVDMAMNYCTVVNDLQLCAAGGNALDTLRFIQNMIKQLSDGYCLCVTVCVCVCVCV